MSERKKIKFFAVIFGVLAVIISGVFWKREASAPDAPLDAFARCLRDRGVVMYGADWCSHCQNQKLKFGSSFRFVPSVECPKNPDICLKAGVGGFPTWIFPENKKIEGELELREISLESGCKL